MEVSFESAGTSYRRVASRSLAGNRRQSDGEGTDFFGNICVSRGKQKPLTKLYLLS